MTAVGANTFATRLLRMGPLGKVRAAKLAALPASLLALASPPEWQLLLFAASAIFFSASWILDAATTAALLSAGETESNRVLAFLATKLTPMHAEVATALALNVPLLLASAYTISFALSIPIANAASSVALLMGAGHASAGALNLKLLRAKSRASPDGHAPPKIGIRK